MSPCRFQGSRVIYGVLTGQPIAVQSGLGRQPSNWTIIYKELTMGQTVKQLTNVILLPIVLAYEMRCSSFNKWKTLMCCGCLCLLWDNQRNIQVEPTSPTSMHLQPIHI